MIQLHHLFKTYGKLEVLRDIDLELTNPGVTAILGPNGSGKSTMIKLILGLVIPSRGEIIVRGQKIHRSFTYRNDISYLPQIARFPENLKVKELLKVIEEIRGPSILKDQFIQYFSIESYLDKKLGHLSGGTRQKINLVLTFMYDTPIRILDEPTAGLDPIAMVALRNLIEEERKAGKMILLTTHIIPMVDAMADDLIFLLDGTIHFHGAPAELKQKTNHNDLEDAIAGMMLKAKQLHHRTGLISLSPVLNT